LNTDVSLDKKVPVKFSKLSRSRSGLLIRTRFALAEVCVLWVLLYYYCY